MNFLIYILSITFATYSAFQTTAVPSKSELKQEINASQSVEKNVTEKEISKIAKEIKANELGKVIVVMYHNLVDSVEEEGYYARTRENIRKEFLRMYELGYHFVTMEEFISGKMSIPRGKTPAVLTFDDGWNTDLQLDENGKAKDDTVVGILLSLKEEYPDFSAKATFYLNGPHAFGDSEYDSKKISFLLENGFEIGNHTTTHANLSSISLESAKEEILSQAKRLEKYTNSKSFNFSVPFGEKFEGFEEKMKTDFLGEYKMKSSVNVGWCPNQSPYDKEFDPHSIFRITTGDDDYELHFWLDYLEQNKNERYISDGDDNYLSVPKSQEEKLNKQKAEEHGLKINLYDDLSSEDIANKGD